MKCYDCNLSLSVASPPILSGGDYYCRDCAEKVTRRDGTVGTDDSYNPHAESTSDWTWGKTDEEIERAGEEYDFYSKWF